MIKMFKALYRHKFRILVALRHGNFLKFFSLYRSGVKRMASYASERGHPVVEYLTLRESTYSIGLDHIQMVFASNWLQKCRPAEIYDIGSHRSWILGVSSYYPVTSLDVREPIIRVSTERFSVGNAQDLPWVDSSIDFLVSLHSIEHFGLGAYGDTPDTFADVSAAKEMVRTLKPGGTLIITTTITGGPSFTVYDAHRVYSLSDIHDMFRELTLLEENFFSCKLRKFISSSELISETRPYGWDIYLAAFRKPT